MRWKTAREKLLSHKRKPYLPNPFWFAWHPVVAEDSDGSKVWVWWEVVRQERHSEKGHDGYGGICQTVWYSYKTVPPDQLPPRYQSKPG